MAPEPDPPELIYDSQCPHCRRIKRAVELADLRGTFRMTPIDSDRGRALIEDTHGEFIEAPHLYTDELVYYGVEDAARGVAKEFGLPGPPLPP